jgi:hypothetical protein
MTSPATGSSEKQQSYLVTKDETTVVANTNVNTSHSIEKYPEDNVI